MSQNAFSQLDYWIFKSALSLEQNDKKAWSQPTQTSLRGLQDVLERSRRLATKQDVVATSGKRRWIYDILKTSDLVRLEDVQFTTS